MLTVMNEREPSEAEVDEVEAPRPRRVSRQREAGEATRRETRRRLLAAARAEFSERGYAAATVIRIAERADVSVQTLYSNWGNKRNLLRAVMESSVTGKDDLPLVAGQPPAVVVASLDRGDFGDPRRLLAHLSHQYRLLPERAPAGCPPSRRPVPCSPPPPRRGLPPACLAPPGRLNHASPTPLPRRAADSVRVALYRTFWVQSHIH